MGSRVAWRDQSPGNAVSREGFAADGAKEVKEPCQFIRRQLPLCGFPLTRRAAEKVGKAFHPQFDVDFSRLLRLPTEFDPQFPGLAQLQPAMNRPRLKQFVKDRSVQLRQVVQ